MTRTLCLLGTICLAILLLGHFLAPDSYVARILCLLLLAAAMAQSWNIVGGLAGQISLGHAAFFGIGAYASTIAQTSYGLSPWLGLPAGMAIAALFAAVLSWPTLRLQGPYFALATLAAAEACGIIANTVGITGGPQGLSVPFLGDSLAAMQFRHAGSYIPLFTGLFAFCSLVFLALSHGRIGYYLRAVRDDEQAAEVAGVDTVRVKLTASLASAAMTAACGTTFAQFTFFIDPPTVFSATNISIRMALVAILGGVGTLYGPLLGAILVVPVEEFLNTTLSQSVAGLPPLVFGGVLIAVVLLRPQGLTSLRLPALPRLRALMARRTAP